MDLPAAGHDPVLLDEALAGLDLRTGSIVVDCTLGRAGHAKAITEHLGSAGLLIGLDVDPNNLEFARDRLRDAACPVRIFHASFSELSEVLSQAGIAQVDAIFADLGISTNQLFDDRYGLSFANDMPLDMRIDPRLRQSAADYVNTTREEDLANVLYNLAQERYSRRIARKIGEARRTSPIKSTERLADLVRSVYPARECRPDKIDPATRTFMALRMQINQELSNLEALLEQAPKMLKTGGRLAIISFHSGEDRMVKQAFRSAEQTGLLRLITKKPLTPSDPELARNPRSRSAKLRVALKL